MARVYKIDSGKAIALAREIEQNRVALTQKVGQLQRLIEQQVEAHTEMEDEMLNRLADLLEVPANMGIAIDNTRLAHCNVAFLEAWDPTEEKPITHKPNKRIH